MGLNGARAYHGGFNAIHPRARCAHPQPEGPEPRAAARAADRGHGPVRLGQVLAHLRHALRRGAAALRRVPVRLRAPVPRHHGQARRRQYRGPFPRDRDRAEGELAQSALDGRHRHRGLRLPAPAVRARRHSALSGARHRSHRADGESDGRPGAQAPRGHPRGAARAIAHRAQGRAPRAAAGPGGAGLRARAHRRAHPRAGRAAGARCQEAPHHRGGRRSHARAPRWRAAPGGIIRDRAAPRRRTGTARLPRGPRARGADLLQPPRLPGVRLQRADAGAEAVLLQQPLRRLPELRWPGGAGVLRPGARGAASAPVPRRRRGARLGPPQRSLLPADPVARAALRLRHRDALDRAAAARAARAPERQRRGGDRVQLQGRRRPQDPQAPSLRGHRPQPHAPLPRDRVADGARGAQPLPRGAPLPGVPGHAAEPRGALRVRRRQEPAGACAPARRARARGARGHAAAGLARRGRRQDREERERAAAVPEGRGPRLPDARSPRRDALGRGIPAHPPREPGRLRPHRRHVHPG